MSVINKMLRDLDRRAGAQDAPFAPTATAIPLMRGTASVTALPVARIRPALRARGARPITITILALALVALGAAGWSALRGGWPFAQEPARPPGALAISGAGNAPAVATAAAPVLEPAPQNPPPVAVAQPAMMPTVKADVALAGAGQALTISKAQAAALAASGAAAMGAMEAMPPSAARTNLAATQAASVAARGLASTTGRAAAAAPAAAVTPATATAVTAAPTPVPAQVAPAAQPTLATAPASTAVPWQDAAMETVAQSQRLWASGARDGALELLRDAMQVLERAHGPELETSGAAPVLAMVRELARMELAQGHPAAVLALLQRNERLLPARADLWALRASAAQRLGQHAEASAAYQNALKIRPGESRWMLGAAVSLAALGQLEGAAQLAEQARQMAPVSPEVLAYLRQLGVALRDR